MGISKQKLVYEREPHEFKHPYGFDQPLDNWADLVVANGFFDRAGICLLSDVHRNTSYGPLKRALVKVDMEGDLSPAARGGCGCGGFPGPGARRRRFCSGRSTGCSR